MSHIRGRFQKDADKSVAEYTASIPFDWRLYPYDIAGSIAHAKMLAKQGIILEKEAEVITGGLASIRDEIEQGKFQFKPELEDIHMNIEADSLRRWVRLGASSIPLVLGMTRWLWTCVFLPRKLSLTLYSV